MPTEIVLVVLAVPPILSNTYAGVQNVDPAVRDAARGHGHDAARRCSFKVELPVRAAADHLRAAQRHAAGDRHRDHRGVRVAGRPRPVHHRRAGPAGLSRRWPPGAVLVAVLAIAVDLLLALVQRCRVARAVRRVRHGRGPSARMPRRILIDARCRQRA